MAPKPDRREEDQQAIDALKAMVPDAVDFLREIVTAGIRVANNEGGLADNAIDRAVNAGCSLIDKIVEFAER